MNSRFVIISIFFTFVGCGISVPVQTTTTEGITAKDVSTEVQLRIQYPNTTTSDPTTKPTTPSDPTTKPTTPSDPTTKPTIPSDPTTKPTIPSDPTTKPTTPSDPTTKPTTPSDPTTKPTTPSNPTTKPTTPSSTTPTTNSTTPLSTTSPVSTAMTTDTPGGKSSNERQFDGPSFIGGIVLTVGLTAIGFIAFKFYIAGKGGDSKYRTLY